MRNWAATVCDRLQNDKGRSIGGCPKGGIASDLSAARHFINKIKRGREGFFYI
jgi:hypothetical protein